MAEPLVPDAPETASQMSPPLGIRFLFLWTACSAILLMIHQVMRDTIIAVFGSHLANQQNYFRFYDAYMAIVEGLAVCTLGIWFVRRRHGLPFPIEPGEWLLVALGIAKIIETAAMALWIGYYAQTGPSLRLMFMHDAYLMGALLVGLYFTFAAYHSRVPSWWRMEILCCGGLWFAWFLYHLAITFPAIAKNSPIDYRVLSYYCNFPMLGLFICLGMDRWKRVPHGWLHYVGVGVLALKLMGEMAVDAFDDFFV